MDSPDSWPLCKLESFGLAHSSALFPTQSQAPVPPGANPDAHPGPSYSLPVRAAHSFTHTLFLSLLTVPGLADSTFCSLPLLPPSSVLNHFLVREYGREVDAQTSESD